MRRSLHPRTIGGWLCLLAMLVLSSPGVKVVRADDALVSERAPGPVCAAPSAVPPGGDVEALLERWRMALVTEAARSGEPDPDAPVALNNRGYNDGPSPVERALREIQRQQP